MRRIFDLRGGICDLRGIVLIWFDCGLHILIKTLCQAVASVLVFKEVSCSVLNVVVTNFYRIFLEQSVN